MDDKVGSEVPTEQQISNWAQRISEIAIEMEACSVKLTVDDRKHQLRFRPGGEPIIAQVGDLATKYGIALPDMPVQGMIADLTLAQRLAPLASQVGLLAERLSDTVSQARSEAWQAATGNYSVLVRVSVANPSLASELVSAREFFARKSQASKGGGGEGAGAPPEK